VHWFVEQESYQLADWYPFLLGQVLQAHFQINRDVEVDSVGFALLSLLALLLFAGSLITRQAYYILATLPLAKQRFYGWIYTR
jgi:hypothetical protein